MTYVDIRFDSGKPQRALSSPSSSGSGVGALDTTFHSAGAVTVHVNTDFRSGCSNVANTRRASGTSNCV